MRVLRINISTSMKTIKNTAKAIRSDVESTSRYYKSNAKQGWQNGKRLSGIRRYGKTKSFMTELHGTIAKTKIRGQDILPAILAGVGTATPIPGGGVVGYQFGRLINKLFKFAK